MPELPEVETIVRALRDGGRGGPPVLGRVIQAAYIQWNRTLAEPGVEEFLPRIVGQSVTGVGRRGKFIILQLSQDALLVHLRMSGDLRVEPVLDEHGNPIPLLLHDRLVLDFADVYRLAFNDPRKFGRVWLVVDPEHVVGGLGPEPFDEHLTPEVLYQRLHSVSRQMKPLLLDQSFLAGMGNIYTDEALFLARIHPLRSSQSISPEEAERLLIAMRAVLSEGIHRNGASIDWVYRGGDFQNNFQVYQRTGQPCARCGNPVIKIAVGQRGTHYCPVCQQMV
jgi:formamidopyrimidine-DNA glycosylase